jgi:hypothetical protein
VAYRRGFRSSAGTRYVMPTFARGIGNDLHGSGCRARCVIASRQIRRRTSAPSGARLSTLPNRDRLPSRRKLELPRHRRQSNR